MIIMIMIMMLMYHHIRPIKQSIHSIPSNLIQFTNQLQQNLGSIEVFILFILSEILALITA